MLERLTPGAVTLAALRHIHEGAGVTLAEGWRKAVEASAETVSAMIRRGDTAYGVNTGFGKLAQTRIAHGLDLPMLDA
jgi:histidine ammonia-lyase